jgi:hypothetical protein
MAIMRADKLRRVSTSMYEKSLRAKTVTYLLVSTTLLATTTALSALTAPAAQALDLPLTVAADQLSGYERSLFKIKIVAILAEKF